MTRPSIFSVNKAWFEYSKTFGWAVRFSGDFLDKNSCRQTLDGVLSLTSWRNLVAQTAISASQILVDCGDPTEEVATNAQEV